MKSTMKRNPSMDVIRCVALLCVISVHFFFNSGFYEQPVTGAAMYLMTIVRSILLICVPLFLLLSGYLMGKKRPEAAYFRKIFRTLGIYLLACICCNLFRILRGEPVSAAGLVATVLNFTAAPYAWYVEMYLGLFFLIPFLNLIYDNLEGDVQKKLLLGSLILLTALPGVLNIHNLTSVAFWKNPASVSDYHQLIPGWWSGYYPVTYYILGRWLREHPRKYGTGGNLIALILTGLVFGLFCIYRSRNVPLVLGAWQDYNALPVMLLGILAFRLLENLDYSRWPAALCTVTAKLSQWTLGAYLVSWIFDQLFYPMLDSAGLTMTEKFCHFPVVVPGVFACSLILSGVMNGIYDAGERLCRRICRRNVSV